MGAIPSDIRSAFARTIAFGLIAALLAGSAVWAAGRRAFGSDDREAAARVQSQVEARVHEGDDELARLTARATENPALIRSAPRDPQAAQALFDSLAAAIAPGAEGVEGITLYDVGHSPVAWSGRVVDLPRARLESGPSVFLTSDALGPRLVRVTPIVNRNGPAAPEPLGAAVAEELLPSLEDASGVPVSVVADAPAQPPGGYVFLIHAADGSVLGSASIQPTDIAAAREHWRRLLVAAVLAVLALTLAACAAPLLELRRRKKSRAAFALASLAIFAVIVGTGSLVARSLDAGLGASAAPYRLLADSLTLLGVGWSALDLAERRRLARPPLRAHRGNAQMAWIATLYFAAGAAVAALILGYEVLLRRYVYAVGLDLLHFSLHPLSAPRSAISFALLLFHAGVVWAGAFVLRLVRTNSRRPRRGSLDLLAIGAGAAGALASTAALARMWEGVPIAAAVGALLAMVLCAVALSRPRGAFRRASHGARLALLYAALLLPAIAMYPSLAEDVGAAKERMVAGTFAPQALNMRQDLSRQSDRALEQIDAMASLPSLVAGTSDADTPSTDQAFTVWSATALAEHRITSAIELYAANGRLVSRFALNLPEYASALNIAPGRHDDPCRWTTFEEVTSFAASDRHVLRASRSVCTPDGVIGSIVVRVMLDYRTLPFISSLRPDIEPPSAHDEEEPSETTLGPDVEFILYGWSRAPLYSFGTGIWPLDASTFERLVASRDPFWTTIAREDGRAYRVYFVSDRGGIYALGYPEVTLFGHLLNLAELVVLTGVLWALLIGGSTLFNAATFGAPASGRALLREVRSSFYRKLWLAFVGAAAAPVLILAFATRTYFANQFNASVKDDAVRTATVAQRLVEDYAALQPRQSGTLEGLDDQVMILVSQAIDQAVNLFDPKHLQATSEPDLFASGVLSLRTPDDVYRAVALNRLPTFVGVEEIGRTSYLLAAARVRAGQREGIVTVPLTLRAQEADQQIDNLDRRVVFASVLFVMLGAAVGYWMAERIADPVSRLTRATRRIARGELDVRVAATSSDELRRLVEDFNRMAADLRRQRVELERTQRLEAWADMARQVAHDIKNPLTPIQLSAEHARRVNADRGRPLSPVLDDCVNSILTQVKLLRQIAAEFSSFASSPTARPEPTDVPALIDDVVAPYRTGLAGRVAIEVNSEPVPKIPLDRNLFSRALTNLIENALFAMPGGGRLTIASRLTQPQAGRREPAVVVTVSDTGTGMDQEAMKRLFEPYFSTKSSGTGLGLTIAKRNVELNGGTIQVASERGVGTTVTITLPIGGDGGDGGNGSTGETEARRT